MESLRPFLCLLVLASAAVEQSQSQSNLPAGVQGDLARSLVNAVNGDDIEAQKRFVAARFSEVALKGKGADQWFSVIRKLSQHSGGIDLVEAWPEDPRVLRMKVKTRRGNHWARMVLISSRSDSTKISDIFIFPEVDPTIEKNLRFPDGRFAETGIARILEEQCGLRASKDLFSGVVLVAKGDRVIFNRAYGMADQSFQAPNNVKTRFHLGSMDKMFTGVAIAQLVQSGKLSFGDTLSSILTDFPNKAISERVTIHQLLTHTAGTGDFIAHPEFRAARERFAAISDYIPLIAGETLRFDPGERFSYSNSGYVLLGAVIEKLSGESYFDYVHNHIFKVAGMEETGYYELNAIVPNLAVGYLRNPEEDPFGLLPRRSNVMFIPFKGNSAGGGYSNARDLLKFSRALQEGKLLGPEFVETVTRGKVPIEGGPRPETYAYGFSERLIEGKLVRGMGGGGAGSGVDSNMMIFWNGSYTVIVLGNYDPPSADELKEKICAFLAKQG